MQPIINNNRDEIYRRGLQHDEEIRNMRRAMDQRLLQTLNRRQQIYNNIARQKRNRRANNIINETINLPIYRLPEDKLRYLELNNPTYRSLIIRKFWEQLRQRNLLYNENKRIIRVDEETARFLEFDQAKINVVNNNISQRTAPNTLEENEGLHLFNINKYIYRIINQYREDPAINPPIDIGINQINNDIIQQQILIQGVQIHDIQIPIENEQVPQELPALRNRELYVQIPINRIHQEPELLNQWIQQVLPIHPLQQVQVIDIEERNDEENEENNSNVEQEDEHNRNQEFEEELDD